LLKADQCDQGPMLWLFKYFRRKFQRKNWRFWIKTKLKNVVFEKNDNFFAEKCRKSQKIVIICNIDCANFCHFGHFYDAQMHKIWATFSYFQTWQKFYWATIWASFGRLFFHKHIRSPCSRSKPSMYKLLLYLRENRHVSRSKIWIS
jgi:hypothetical protein